MKEGDEMIDLIGLDSGVKNRDPDKECIVLNGVKYRVGHVVRRYDHVDGFDGYIKKECRVSFVNNKTGRETDKFIRGPRYAKRKGGVDGIRQLVVHHSGGDGADPSSMYNTLYLERGLSVHFACEDDGRIWQFNDLVDCCWHAGKHNRISVGVELCLYPLAKRRPRYYDEARRARTGNLPHDVRDEIIHGKQMTVFVMPENQWQALALVYAATWVAIGDQRSGGFDGAFDNPPVFPRNGVGDIPRTVSSLAMEHEGMLAHFMITRRKIDPCGFPFEDFENSVAYHYEKMRDALGK